MPNYKQGKIYCLRTYQSNEVYVGSTCQSLCQRLADHRRNYKRWKNGKFHYVSSFKLLEFEDCYIELVQDYPCEAKRHLEKLEGQYIRKMGDNCVNKCIPGRDRKEYYKDNKEHIAQYEKEYYEDNKEHIIKQSKEYYEANKEHIVKQKKEYRQQNKEHIAKQKKEYYQQNKDKINENFTCQCGGKYTRQGKSQHARSIKHQAYLKSLQTE